MKAPGIQISIAQIDKLNNVRAGLESVQWLCYLALCGGTDSEDGVKTAKSVHNLLEPWQEGLDDVLEELAGQLAEIRRERQERKEQEDSKK